MDVDDHAIKMLLCVLHGAPELHNRYTCSFQLVQPTQELLSSARQCMTDTCISAGIKILKWVSSGMICCSAG